MNTIHTRFLELVDKGHSDSVFNVMYNWQILLNPRCDWISNGITPIDFLLNMTLAEVIIHCLGGDKFGKLIYLQRE